MQNTFQQITEIIENLQLICGKDAHLAQIEKDVVLEKMRNLYLQVSQLSVEPASDHYAEKALAEEAERKAAEQKKLDEFSAALNSLESSKNAISVELKQLEERKLQLQNDNERLTAEKTDREAEVKQLEAQVKQMQALETRSFETAVQQTYSVQQGMNEDVDLFFDMEHESYGPTEVQPTPAQQEPAQTKPVQVQNPVPEAVESKPEPKQEETPVPQPKPEPIAEPEELESLSDEDDLLQFMPAPKREEEKTPKIEVNSEPKVEAKVEEAKPSVEQTPLSKAVHQNSNQRSLNDLFNAQREDHSLGAQFQRAKVVDLTKAISINEKFTYIRELFSNRGEEFSAAIQKLNQCGSMEEAFDCLDVLKKQYFWDSASPAYLSLCDLLRRKFL